MGSKQAEVSKKISFSLPAMVVLLTGSVEFLHCLSHLCIHGGQFHYEPGPAWIVCLDSYPATMFKYDSLHNRRPKPVPRPRVEKYG